MASDVRPAVSEEIVKDRMETWQGFMRLTQYTTVATIATLILMALFLL